MLHSFPHVWFTSHSYLRGEVLPAHRSSHAVWSAGFLLRREGWDLDIQRVWNPSLPQELGGTKSCKVSWQATPQSLSKTRRQLLFVNPTPSSNDQEDWVSGSIFTLSQVGFPHVHFTRFGIFPAQLRCCQKCKGSLASLCSEENSRRNKCTEVAQLLAPQLTDTLL